MRSLGVPEYNVVEWEQSDRGFRTVTQQSVAAVSQYYTARSQGISATTRFFADLDGVKPAVAKKVLTDVTKKALPLYVPLADTRMEIRDFVEKHHLSYFIGSTFYQLSKTETIQPRKLIAIQNKKDGKIYMGANARDLLGLPYDREVKVAPGNFGDWTMFVQSTSTNRHLIGNTQVLYFADRTILHG